MAVKKAASTESKVTRKKSPSTTNAEEQKTTSKKTATVKTATEPKKRTRRKKVEEVAEVVSTVTKAGKDIIDSAEPAIEKAEKAIKETESAIEKVVEPVTTEIKKRGGRRSKANETVAETPKESPVKSSGGRKKTPKLVIQSQMGGEISADDIYAKVRAAGIDAETVYIKPEENAAYYATKDGDTGSIVLWE